MSLSVSTSCTVSSLSLVLPSPSGYTSPFSTQSNAGWRSPDITSVPTSPIHRLELLRLTRVEASVDSKVAKGQGILEGLLQGAKGWGLPQQVLATIGCVRRFKGGYKECTLKSSTETQRDP